MKDWRIIPLKKYFKQPLALLVSLMMLTGLLAGCRDAVPSRVTMSKSLYVVNQTDSVVTSLTLDVEGTPLAEPIEILDGPLEPGGVTEVFFSMPEKQAKTGEWIALAVTEMGTEYSKPFTIGDMNPHGENPLKTFYVKWFDTGAGGHFSVGASFSEPEEPASVNPLALDIPFEADPAIIGDPPEGSLSVFEAQAQLAALLAGIEEFSFWEEGMFYLYQGIEDGPDGLEHYHIYLGQDDGSEGGRAITYSYLVSYDGTVYQQDMDGAWWFIGGTMPSDPPEIDDDDRDANWWGEYASASGALGIANYNGQSFSFLFLSDEGEEFEGTAAVLDHNSFNAEYMDLFFVLSDDCETITVSQSEQREDSDLRTIYLGEYTRQ